MVEFVSYDGKYPCLCMGTLTIKVDGKAYRFNHAMISGGCICSGPHTDWDMWSEQGDWEIDLDEHPELEPYKEEITRVVTIMLKKADVELTDFEKSLKHIMIETLECGDTHNLKADAEMLLRFAQKPAWSEEDENTIKVLMNIIRKSEIIDSIIYTDSLKEKLYDWLKSLRPQPKQEWSEEDEKMIGRIRGMIEAYAFSQSAVDVNGDLCEKEYIDADNWLKSLKQRIGG